MRIAHLMLAGCCFVQTSCVLPPSFGGDLETELEQHREAAQRAAVRASARAVSWSHLPFIDASPRPSPPAWTQRPVGHFKAGPGQLGDLLRLAGRAMGAEVILDMDANRLAAPVEAFQFQGGTAGELAHHLADRLALFWRADEDSLMFSARSVRLFDLAGFADFSDQEDRTQGADAGTDSDPNDGNPQDLRQWQELRERVQLLAGEQAEVLLSAEQGVLTVRAGPQAMRRVEDYLKAWNLASSRQVELDVKLVQVALSDHSGFGLDWSAVRNRMDERFHVAGTAAVGGDDRRLVIGGERDDDSVVTALFSAFANQGRVRVLTNPRGVTMNGRPARIALVTQTAYLARILPAGGSLTGAAGDPGLEPDVAESGFVLRILPKIRGRQILLRLDARISTLKELSEVRSGGQSIQVPTLTESRFSHWARVGSGQTLVLGGVRELYSKQDSGLSPYRSGRREHSEQILLITPRIL